MGQNSRLFSMGLISISASMICRCSAFSPLPPDIGLSCNSFPAIDVSPRAEQADTPTPLEPHAPFTQDQLVPENALSRLGAGQIRSAIPVPGDESILVSTSIGLFHYSIDSFEPLWFSTDAIGGEMVLSPDGTLIAIAGSEGRISFFETSTGEYLRSFDTNSTWPVATMAFSPNGNHLATGQGFTVGLWNTETGEQLCESESDVFEKSLVEVVFSPDGGSLAAIDGTGDWVVVWDLTTGKQIHPFGDGDRWLHSIAISPDGSVLASGRGGGEVVLWDSATGEAIRTFEGHNAWVIRLAFSPDGVMLASAAEDGMLIVWDLEKGQQLYSLDGHDSWISSIAFSSDGDFLMSASDDRVVLWSARTGEHLRTLEGHHDDVTSIAYSPDGRTIAAGYRTSIWSSTVILWDAKTGDQNDVLQGHVFSIEIESLAFSPDGSMLASGGISDGTVRLWDVATGETLNRLSNASSGGVQSVAFSPDGNILAAGTSGTDHLYGPGGRDDIAVPAKQGAVTLWDLESGAKLHTFTEEAVGEKNLGTDHFEIFSVAFSPDGRMVASGTWDDVIVWDSSRGTRLHTLSQHTSLVSSVEFSPDGAVLAAGSWDGTATLWDTATGELLHTLDGDSWEIQSVAVSPDGKILATGSDDSTIILWDVGTGELMHTLEGHGGPVNSVAFSPDGDQLASGSEDGTILIWSVPSW